MKIWSTLRRREPRLDAVERIAFHAHRDGLSWPDLLAQLAPELHSLVGHGAADPRLRSTGIYQVVIRHLTTCWAKGRSTQNETETCSAGA